MSNLTAGAVSAREMILTFYMLQEYFMEEEECERERRGNIKEVGREDNLSYSILYFSRDSILLGYFFFKLCVFYKDTNR